MSSGEASWQLGVSMRQVQLIDARSVQRLKTRGAGSGRPWEPETIAAAIEMLTDGDTTRLTTVARGRLCQRLDRISADHLVRATRRRAQVRRYRASLSFLDRLRAAITLTGSAAVGSDPALGRVFGLAGGELVVVDGYVHEKQARQLVREHHLVEDEDGNVTFRVTEIGLLLSTNVVAVALDLSESLDVRDRSAGLAFLTRRLQSSR